MECDEIINEIKKCKEVCLSCGNQSSCQCKHCVGEERRCSAGAGCGMVMTVEGMERCKFGAERHLIEMAERKAARDAD